MSAASAPPHPTLSSTRTRGRWDGVVVICSTRHPANRVGLICNVLWPSCPAIERVWFVTRSVSPLSSRLICSALRTLSGSALEGWEGSGINMWPRCPAVTKSLCFSPSRVRDECFYAGGKSNQTSHRRIKQVLPCLLSAYLLISDICILHSNSWHLDDKLTLFAVALQSMN